MKEQPIKGYKTEATWFDNYSAFWIIDKSTGKQIALALGKTQDEAAENSIKIISALSTPIQSGEERPFTLEQAKEIFRAGKSKGHWVGRLAILGLPGCNYQNGAYMKDALEINNKTPDEQQYFNSLLSSEKKVNNEK